jgi:hypothetical protein
MNELQTLVKRYAAGGIGYAAFRQLLLPFLSRQSDDPSANALLMAVESECDDRDPRDLGDGRLRLSLSMLCSSGTGAVAIKISEVASSSTQTVSASAGDFFMSGVADSFAGSIR